MPSVMLHHLKTGHKTERLYPRASVLFSDIVRFTPFSASLEPEVG